MKATNTKSIPEFKTLEEERQYWEARGPLVEGKRGRMNRPKVGQKRSSFLAVRLTGEELTRLRDVAARQRLGPSTFARLVLTAAVEPGSKPPTRKTLEEVFEALENNLSQETKDRVESLVKAMFIGKPPYLLELTDKSRLEEFVHLVFAGFLERAGIQLVTREAERSLEAKDKITA